MAPAAPPDHTLAHVTLAGTRIRDAGMVTMENMTPYPHAFRLSARQPPPELKMPGIGAKVDIGRQLALCLAVEAGGGRAAIMAGEAARFEGAAGLDVAEAG